MTSPALAASGISVNSNSNSTSVNIGNAPKIGESGTGTSSGSGSSTSPSVYGYDVSYPQCSTVSTLPTGQQFGVVGVNAGIANNQNPCLAAELAWASSSTGGTTQPRAAVYVNTGNPGDVTPAVADWPTSGMNIYGTCHSGDGDTTACAYEYGHERAAQDMNWAMAAGLQTTGSQWWLDVETANSWSDAKLLANAAVLEGMTSYLELHGGRVGLYSTMQQWGEIVGSYTGSRMDNLYGLPDWVPGATDLAGARLACLATAPLTVGGSNSVAQYVPSSAQIDNDFSCRL